MKVNHVIVANFYVAKMSFNAIRENRILAKISEFTVTCSCCRMAVCTLNPEIFANSVKRHICDAKYSRLWHDLPISANERVILALREDSRK